MSVRYHKVVSSSLFLLTTILAARGGPLQLSHTLLLKYTSYLLSDLRAVFAVDATGSVDAAKDGAGSASFLATRATKSTMDSVLGQMLVDWYCSVGSLCGRKPWEAEIDLELAVDGQRSSQNRLAGYTLPYVCLVRIRTHIWPFLRQIR
jgi:hypothetical protein